MEMCLVSLNRWKVRLYSSSSWLNGSFNAVWSWRWSPWQRSHFRLISNRKWRNVYVQLFSVRAVHVLHGGKPASAFKVILRFLSNPDLELFFFVSNVCPASRRPRLALGRRFFYKRGLSAGLQCKQRTLPVLVQEAVLWCTETSHSDEVQEWLCERWSVKHRGPCGWRYQNRAKDTKSKKNLVNPKISL